MLLTSKQNTSVALTFYLVSRMNTKEISPVETIENSISLRSILQMLFIAPFNHAGFLSSHYINPTRSQRLYQVAVT